MPWLGELGSAQSPETLEWLVSNMHRSQHVECISGCVDCGKVRGGYTLSHQRVFPWIPMHVHSWCSMCDSISRGKGQIEITTSSHCALPGDRVGNSYTNCCIQCLHYFHSKTIAHHIEPYLRCIE